MRKYLFVAVVIVLLGGLILSGCSTPTPTPTPTQAPAPKPAASPTPSPAPVQAPSTAKPAAPQPKLPDTVGLATHASGTSSHIWGVAFADVVSKQTPMKMVVQPTPGPNAWAPLMKKGEVQFGIANQFDAHDMYLGTGAFTEKTDLRAVKNGYRILQCTLVTRADSGIKTIPDLKGKKVAYGCPAMKSLDINTEAYLLNGGLTVKDIIPVPYTGMDQAKQLLIDGRIDAFSHSIGAAAVNEIATSPHGAMWISLDANCSADTLKKMRDLIPGVELMTVNPPITGVVGPTGVITYGSYLMASAAIPDDVVYAVTKVLYDRFDDYKGAHPQMVNWAQAASTKPTTIPFHNGAIKFYKEAGTWTADNDKLQADLLAQK